jgi:hypothetical protein
MTAVRKTATTTSYPTADEYTTPEPVDVYPDAQVWRDDAEIEWKVTRRTIYTIELPEGALEEIGSLISKVPTVGMTPGEVRCRRQFFQTMEGIRLSWNRS